MSNQTMTRSSLDIQRQNKGISVEYKCRTRFRSHGCVAIDDNLIISVIELIGNCRWYCVALKPPD
jgi:hypothetical protein